MDQHFLRAVGQSRGGLDVFAEIMRMRIDGQKIDIDGQRELVGYQEILLAGRNVEFDVVLELEQHGQLCRGLRREVEADARLDDFGFAGGLHVRIENEVRALV